MKKEKGETWKGTQTMKIDKETTHEQERNQKQRSNELTKKHR